jgi:hypothetical protein
MDVCVVQQLSVFYFADYEYVLITINIG